MLKIPSSAHISWNTFDDKTLQRENQESIFLATFADALTGKKHQIQIDYSYYNLGKYEENPIFVLEVYTFEEVEPKYYFTQQYKSIDEAENDINYWLEYFS
jgi:hypothetical protein